MATHSSFFQFLNSVKAKHKAFFTDFLYIFAGTFIITPLLLLYFIITLPFMGYRALISFILSKRYKTKYGYREMVSPGFSTAYALEYLSSLHVGQPSRNTIIAKQVIEGHVPFKKCKERLEKGWVQAQDENQNWKTPELRSYVDSWMGYCYWREESQFNFNSHLYYHKTEESQDVDQFTSDLFEKLMNTPYLPKRSPWDVHVIHGWKHECSPENGNKVVNSNNTEITAVLTRTHHVLGDGISLVYIIYRDLFGICTNDFQKMCDKKVAKEVISSSQKLRLFAVTFIKLMWDFGCIAWFVLWKAKTNTKFHVSDKQELRYVHHMSDLLSMDTVKNVAKKFRVSFSGVLFSSIASAISKSLDNDHPEKFLLVAPRPLPGHPTDRMVNHMTGAAYNMPVNSDIHPVQRLMECDKIFKTVNKSLFPTHVFPVLIYFLSYHIAPIAKFGFKSRHFGASFSNNMANPVPVCAFDNEYRLLEYSGSTGTYDGATGLLILIVGYANVFRFHGLANSDALSKQELESFIKNMLKEINYLTKEAENFSGELPIPPLNGKSLKAR